VDWTLEVVVLPASDIDRAIAFYRDQVGFVLDHDTRTEQMRVAQLTPVGSGCSIVIGSWVVHYRATQQQDRPGALANLNACASTPRLGVTG